MKLPRVVWLLFLTIAGCAGQSESDDSRVAGAGGAGGLKLILVGDVMLGRLVNESLRSRKPAHPWGDTLPVFRKADLRICNLECVIADGGRRWTATPKVFHFRSDARNIAVLGAAGINAVSVANNHALDYGYDALSEMLGILDKAGVRHAGAGANSEEACRPAVMEVHGTRVGFVAFTDNEPAWAAHSDRAGTCFVPVDLNHARAKSFLKIVSRAKSEADFLIVSAHWGGNWGYRPPPDHASFGRALIDSGADVVFGHSAHVFRGIEIYRGKPILYSTGDFVDDYAVNDAERNDESFIFMLETSKGAVRQVSLYPTLIRYLQARLADGEDARRIAGKMRQLCAEFGVEAAWDAGEGCLKISPE